MIYINHRINTLEQLKKVPIGNGIEVDVRYHNNELILHHDPFNHHKSFPEKLDNILQNWQHKGPIILNVKTEGIELDCIGIMNKYKITNWFFLDLSMPFFIKYAIKTNNQIKGFSSYNLAVRFSEYEPLEYALSFAGLVNWVWVDSFSLMPLNSNNFKILKENGFKICLVSPELQNHSLKKINEFKEILKLNNIIIDAICTKRTDLWGQNLSLV